MIIEENFSKCGMFGMTKRMSDMRDRNVGTFYAGARPLVPELSQWLAGVRVYDLRVLGVGGSWRLQRTCSDTLGASLGFQFENFISSLS